MNESDALSMLDDWGDFMRGMDDIGYPKTNTISKAMTEGAGASHESADVATDTPKAVQHVENVVLAMKPDIKKVIKHKYIYRLTQEESAKYCKCSRPLIDKRLATGVSYLAGTLFNYR